MPTVHGDQWTANEETHPRLWEAQEGAQEKAFHRQQIWPQVQNGEEE